MNAITLEADANARLVLAAIERVFNQHDLAAVDEFFSRDFVQHSPYVPPGGREELKAWWGRTVEAMPDIGGAVEHVVASRDSVAVFRTLKGTLTSDLPDLGLRGAGQTLEFRVAHLFQVSDGRIVGHWEVMDSGPAMKLAAASAQ